MELNRNFCYDTSVQDIFLAMRIELDPEIGCMQFDIFFGRSCFLVNLRYK